MADTLNIIGCGQVGQTVGYLFAQHGVDIGAVLNTSYASAVAAVAFMRAGHAVAALADMPPSRLYLLGCPDQQLAGCAAELAESGLVRAGDVAFHCSGATPAATLAPLRAVGAHIASVHPVRSFAAPHLAIHDFKPTYCGMEGDEAALAVLRPLFVAVGGVPFSIDPAQKLLYHAASVLACNCLVALQELGLQTFAQAGVGRGLAMQILAPIVQGTVNNTFRLGTTEALTGPIVRGDAATVSRQLAALQAWQPDVAEVYRLLGGVALGLAEQQGKLTTADIAAVQAVLRG